MEPILSSNNTRLFLHSIIDVPTTNGFETQFFICWKMINKMNHFWIIFLRSYQPSRPYCQTFKSNLLQIWNLGITDSHTHTFVQIIQKLYQLYSNIIISIFTLFLRTTLLNKCVNCLILFIIKRFMIIYKMFAFVIFFSSQLFFLSQITLGLNNQFYPTFIISSIVSYN